ncbi:hypothetical protein DFH11DRAFT_1684209 [Phellopilus nigrolimitatus]|nr:hypothetical protein DFH11DRAFT_1684209 [Phellopilus nigrolimitatus]
MLGGPSGAWSTHEWFPSLVKSSIALGMLPDADGVSASAYPVYLPPSSLILFARRIGRFVAHCARRRRSDC